MAIDVHWSLFDSPYYQDRNAMDWFWDTAEPVLYRRSSSTEALLIHLCGHLALHHGTRGLLWGHDIVEADAVRTPRFRIAISTESQLSSPLRVVL